MSLFAPYGLNSALKNTDSPFGQAIGDLAKAKQFGQDMNKLKKIAASAEPSPRGKAETVGKMLMSGMLRAGAGPNGNASLQKRAQERRFPIMSDNPEKTQLNKSVSTVLSGLRGHAGHPAVPWLARGHGSSGVGRGVRALKAANDANLPMLPGVQSPIIDENAIQVMNTLPDARVRQGVINALTLRPPSNPNDSYRWLQSIVALREQISEMCEGMGLDPTALTDLLDRRVEFYDPMVQTAPATNAPATSNVGPTTEDFTDWRGRARPPAEPIDPDGPQLRDRNGGYLPGFQHDDFAGATRTDLNPDFRNDEKLAKFYDHAKKGIDIRKTQTDRREYEKYGLVVVKAEIDGPLRDVILQAHALKSRSPAAFAKFRRDPDFGMLLREIHGNPNLSRAMKGAAVALIA